MLSIRYLLSLFCFAAVFFWMSLSAAFPADRMGSMGLYQQGAQQMSIGNDRQAIELFKSAISKDPSNPMPYLVLGDCYIKHAGDYRQAIFYYEKFLTLSGPEVDQFRADVYKKLGDSCVMGMDDVKNAGTPAFSEFGANAVDAYKKALESDFSRDGVKKSYAVNVSIAHVYTLLGKYDDAEKIFDSIEQAKNFYESPEYFYYKGVLLRSKKKYNESLALFSKIKNDSDYYGKAIQQTEEISKERRFENIFYIVVFFVVLFVVAAIIVYSLHLRKQNPENSVISTYEYSDEELFADIKFKTVSEAIIFSMNHLLAIINMPTAYAFLPNREQNRLFLVKNTSIGIMSEVDIVLQYSARSVSDWISQRGGSPFVYKTERREVSYIRAFPDSHIELEHLQVRIGVPFIVDEFFIGIIYFACDNSSRQKNLFRKNFEKNAFLIKKISVRLASIVKASIEREALYINKETGINNERAYNESLPALIEEAKLQDRPLSLVLFEIDDYESLSNKFGIHSVARLREMTIDSVLHLLESRGTLYQIADSRFAIILQGFSFDSASSFAEDLRLCIHKVKLTYQSDPLAATISFGTFPTSTLFPDKLHEQVETALAEGLKHGGNLILTAEKQLRVMETIKISREQVLAVLNRKQTEETPASEEESLTDTPKKSLFAPKAQAADTPAALNIRSPHQIKKDDDTEKPVVPAFRPISAPIPVPATSVSKIDPLTGFFSRAVMEQTLLQEVQRLKTHPRSSAFLYFGFDNFAGLREPKNASLMKDVLKKVSSLWSSFLPKDAIIAKIEENGFVIFLPGESLKGANVFAKRLCDETKENLSSFGDFTISVGLSVYPDIVVNFKNIVINSRNAMVVSMKEGGNKVSYISPQSK